MSRCSSPMPEITVWPVSSSNFTTKVGSSSESLASPAPSLSWSALVLGSTATEMTGMGNADRLQHHGLVRVADRVAGGGVLQAHHGHDVARVRRFQVLAVVGVHLQDPPDALLAVLRAVQHVGAAVEHAGVDAQVGEPPDVGVAHDLERQRRERLGVVGLAGDVLVLLEGLVALDRRHVERAGQVLHDGVEHELHALVLERRAAQHRDTLVRQGGAADRAAELLEGGLLLGDELLHQGFVVVGELLEELVARRPWPLPCTPRGSRCPSSPRPSRLPSSGPSSPRGR